MVVAYLHFSAGLWPYYGDIKMLYLTYEMFLTLQFYLIFIQEHRMRLGQKAIFHIEGTFFNICHSIAIWHSKHDVSLGL